MKLEKSPVIQLEFLDKLAQQYARSPEVFDENMIAIHIKLLCEADDSLKLKKKVLEQLKAYERYPPICLQICSQYNVKDAWAYLEEKSGSKEAIMKSIALRFEIFEEYFYKIIKKNDYEATNKQKEKLKEKLEETINVLVIHFSNEDVYFIEILVILLGNVV